jgi:hypothetical protein
MRKLRKAGAVDQDGNLITIPRLLFVTGTNKPPGWDRWSPAEKVEHLLRLSLDRMRDYLSWPADDLDPHRAAQRRPRSFVLSRWSRRRSGIRRSESARDTGLCRSCAEDDRSVASGSGEA